MTAPIHGLNNAIVNVATCQSVLSIRQAINIQSELAVANALLKQGETEARSGVLISAYTEAEIIGDLARGGRLYLAKDMRNDKCVGYLLHLPGTLFYEENATARIVWEKTRLASDSRQAFENGSFIYLSQIGVRFAHQGIGVAKSLLETAESQLQGAIIACAIMRMPLDNVRSAHFFTRKGYSKVGQVHTPHFRGIERLCSDLLIKHN